MGLFRRKRRGRLASSADEAHLEEFARTRRGVEAYIEPRTAVTDTTVVLVADTGEWTRRRVAGPQAAHALAYRLGIPAYDAAIVGYPQRMRDWTRRRAQEEEARRRADSGGQQ
ncbi:hypothetical protein C3Y87_05555 [Carbonactinospora thermoautotrophica]|uniref:Uncharacterized protein n=1 Tax=Carbonactinospora thermoautotrophica TaxID=1469144 RepID=A0A132MUY7_9ACTN|nr:hypothetical protein [Carbonactinospora thermoautotrophica]KWX00236.1 hypothetical protein TH66_15335 [Carbonactinospora thermoautotrophica]KWX01728.1 hypothetical protein LI90_2760 [Carbonactinospora thermoautotrophica]KWX10360.1 hypothetical protein TR74_04075 [Carbonactinospora thermoautotrophica]MCX9190886.1 hypothetical protein [Carbonactinospora thermoautotrophica]